MGQKILSSFQAKITILLVSAILAVAMLSNLVVYQFTLRVQFAQLQDKLKSIAQTAALTVDANKLLSIPRTQDGVATSEYKEIAERLNKIKDGSSRLRFIYIMGKTGQDGVWQFLVDPETQKKNAVDPAYPGDRYDAGRFPEMMNAFNGATVDSKIRKDEWGETLSGYAPVLDKDGRAIAVLGVDMMAADIYAMQKRVHVRMLWVVAFGVILALILGFIVSHRVAVRVRLLAEGMRRVSRGDLAHEVIPRGSDEIADLAVSFNRMTENLREERRKNQDYFYSVIQTLVRVVEAKDQYTKGHSERVSEYSARIAYRMGFPAHTVELLRHTAVLHDIGKMGIQDNVLNKPGKLTQEEWDLIRQHPTIGEEILRPVAIDSAVLAIVRGHHERFDGKGYPDQLNGEQTNIFAQILSVADAYDAMVSSRAYRSALSKEVAVEELKKNKGTQFNPLVIDAFIAVLREEDMAPRIGEGSHAA